MLALNIQMQSIHLSNAIISENDKVRISITTLPDGQKQAQTMEVKEMSIKQPSFKIEMNEKTEKVIIVFRKVSFFEPIIASTVIRSDQIKVFKELCNNEHKKISIFEPIQNKNNNNKVNKENRKIVGSMEVDFTLYEVFSRLNYHVNKEKKQEFNVQSFSKVDSLMMNQANGNKDFIFQDLIPN